MTAVINDFKNGITFTGAASTDNASLVWTLLGGRYGLVTNATWGGGSLTISIQCPDGTTYVAAMSAITADTTAVLDLPPGTYKAVIATATAVQMALIPIPYLQAA